MNTQLVPSEAAAPEQDRIQADLILLHAPSVFDFRTRDDVLFAFMSDSDSVNVTSIYEMYPLGFFSLCQSLRAQGHTAQIVNVASLMLQHPTLDVARLLARLEAPVFGFDLHWMAQCHGAVELARLLREIHPEAMIIFGGISATYYAEQLMDYPWIDVVVQGYDTLMPVERLVATVKSGERDLAKVPNLIYRDESGTTVRTGFGHKPMERYNDAAVDWSFYRDVPTALGAGKLIMTLPNTGCAYDCPWCGGSRTATRKIMGVRKTLIRKDIDLISRELRSLGDAAQKTAIYALQCYSEGTDRLSTYLDVVAEMGYRQVYFEQFHLPSDEMMAKMARSTDAFIMLSPESHDPIVSKLAGRGTYTMDELESWIPRALGAGISGIMVWFFIGMPRQDRASVAATVDYCARLLERFPGGRVLPLLCPMVPFLDPGSEFFERPDAHGYRIFHRTLEEHRQAMVEPLWHHRLNYETRWLSRQDLQEVTYDSIARLVQLKLDNGILPRGIARGILENIVQTRDILARMARAIELDGSFSPALRREISAYNQASLAFSSDQIIPVPRPLGGRWFDDFTVPASIIAACSTAPNPARMPP